MVEHRRGVSGIVCAHILSNTTCSRDRDICEAKAFNLGTLALNPRERSPSTSRIAARADNCPTMSVPRPPTDDNTFLFCKQLYRYSALQLQRLWL